MYNENFAIVKGTITTPEAGSGVMNANIDLNYPEGFTRENCVIISLMSETRAGADGYWTAGGTGKSVEVTRGNYGLQAGFQENKIIASWYKINDNESSKLIDVRIILMKLPTGMDATLLGDVNLDGSITEDDKTLLANYITEQRGYEALTFQQYANGDCDPDRDGKLNSSDTLQLTNYLNGTIDHL